MKLKRILSKVYRTVQSLYRQFLIHYRTYRLRRICVCCGQGLFIGGPTSFSGKIYLGDNCNFNGMIIQGGGTVKIGNNFHSGIECMMVTQNHDYDTGDFVPYGTGFEYKTIVIKDNVWLGNRVTITGNTTIGEGAIVAAGSVVCKDVPDFAIVGGNPAKIIKYRDIEHYKLLKNQNKFH